ncbi:hypothetical protein V6N12_058630 [Hibiscus sabdariffa]|uniref:Uncharacterized protein n=1 Tax=Hibiscus sabdariffa TaxID=183260 RepID=A0ABR2ET75_9ROSI
MSTVEKFRPRCPFNDVFLYLKKEQPILVPHFSKNGWRWLDDCYKWPDERSKTLHKDQARALSMEPITRIKDDEAWIGAVRDDMGFYSDSHREQGLKKEVGGDMWKLCSLRRWLDKGGSLICISLHPNYDVVDVRITKSRPNDGNKPIASGMEEVTLLSKVRRSLTIRYNMLSWNFIFVHALSITIAFYIWKNDKAASSDFYPKCLGILSPYLNVTYDLPLYFSKIWKIKNINIYFMKLPHGSKGIDQATEICQEWVRCIFIGLYHLHCSKNERIVHGLATENSWLECLIRGSMDKGRESKGLQEDEFVQMLDSPSRPSALFLPTFSKSSVNGRE